MGSNDFTLSRHLPLPLLNNRKTCRSFNVVVTKNIEILFHVLPTTFTWLQHRNFFSNSLECNHENQAIKTNPPTHFR